MLRNLLFALALLAVSPPSRLAAQASPSTPIPSRDERIGIRSAVLGEDREIWVHLPPGANSGERFDVVYVLDAHALSPVTSGVADYRLTMQIPPRVVVVGITSRSSEGRGRDFTPVVDTTRRRWWPETGKADQFLRFLDVEVFPLIEARYPVTRHRTIIGHSLAGLFVLHALAARPFLFEQYVAISPTIPWGHEAVLTSLETRLRDLPGARRLYVSAGNEEEGYPEGMDHLEALLRRAAPATLKWKMERYPALDHTGVVPPSVSAGLEFIFDSSH